jgi:hypothetical protein
VRQLIVELRQDPAGEWIAELACGHHRHVRHRPPFDPRPGLLDEAGRRRLLGTPLECGVCRAEAAEVDAVDPEAGGDPACWVGVLCPACGAVRDGGPHRDGCPAGPVV